MGRAGRSLHFRDVKRHGFLANRRVFLIVVAQWNRIQRRLMRQSALPGDPCKAGGM